MRSASLVFALALLTLPTAHAEGVLHVGNVRSEESRITVPISLQGDVAEGVASMNFELTYNPESVRIVGVDTGSAARQSGKQIQWHETAPGRLNVVLMGFNQQTVQSGEIAELTVEPLQSEVRNARLHIGNSTFASTNGDPIPSKGSTGTLSWQTRDDGNADDRSETSGGTRPPDATVDDPDVPLPNALGTAARARNGPIPNTSSPASVPESVERRLMAARQRAEALRPLLGAAPDGAALDDTAESTSEVDTEISDRSVERLENAAENAVTDMNYPISANDSSNTPEKNLENVDATGHNNVASSVLERGSSRFIAVWPIAAVAVIFLAFRLGKGAR